MTPNKYIFSEKLDNLPNSSFVGKLIYFIALEIVPWLKKENEDQSGGPRINLEVFGDEVSF